MSRIQVIQQQPIIILVKEWKMIGKTCDLSSPQEPFSTSPPRPLCDTL